MRYLFVPLLLVLAGCLTTQAPRNPMKRAEGAAPVSSAAPASVATKTVAAPARPLRLNLNKVAMMKELFLVQRLWLAKYGVQIRRKRVKVPAPRKSRAY